MEVAIRFLARTQRADGAWLPLWFGNENVPDETNPTYGTARVLVALRDAALSGISISSALTARGVKWLIGAQKEDGSWGGDAQAPSSVEETALAVEALATFAPQAASHGAHWLAARVAQSTWRESSPIGFYFARLWYYEKLYPVIWALGALQQAAVALEAFPSDPSS